MGKIINFIYNNGKYQYVLDSLINPVIEHLPEGSYSKSSTLLESALNISFFREIQPHIGIFISHGIADKNWRNGDLIKDYDYIFVSGMAWRDKLIRQKVDKNKIFITGYTKLDPIFQGIYTKQKYDKSVILYAPTHSTTKEVSLKDKFEIYFDKLRDKYIVLESVHPANKETKKPTFQELIDADIIISDSGSIIYEAWALGKHVVFPDWIVKDFVTEKFKGSFEDKIYREEIGLHANNINGVIDLIEYGLKNPINSKVVDFIEGIFPTSLRGNSGKITAEILTSLSEI